MKLVLPFALAGFIAVSTPAFAQSAFDGVWKIDLASAQLSDRPDVLSLQDGVFTCSSCVPVYSIPADGEMHKVEGIADWDETSMRILDSRTVEEARMLNGRLVGTSRSAVSADGATLTTTWTATPPDSPTISGEGTMSRIAAGETGAHAISGSWRNAGVTNVSGAGITATMRLADGVFSFRAGTGYSYDAPLGGPPVPITGDRAGATATARQLADGSVEVTTYINGEATARSTRTPVADGSMMMNKYENLILGTTANWRLIRQ